VKTTVLWFDVLRSQAEANQSFRGVDVSKNRAMSGLRISERSEEQPSHGGLLGKISDQALMIEAKITTETSVNFH
jgi:hypothetical protein